jgi:signal transduction histidine kinase
MLHFSPVYHLSAAGAAPSTVEQRRTLFRGVIATVLNFEQLLLSLRAQLGLRLLTSEALIAVYDEAPAGGGSAYGGLLGCITTLGVPLPSYATPAMTAEVQLAAAALIADAPAPNTHKVLVAQRLLTIIVTPVPETVDHVEFASANSLLIAGVVICAVVTAALGAIIWCSMQASSLQMRHRFQSLLLESRLRDEILSANAEHAAALSARSDVLAFVCHELRNPLNAVYGMAQVP